MPKNRYASNSWKKHATGEDKETKQFFDNLRAICRRLGYNCETEKEFIVDLHDTNELYPKGTIRRYPVDAHISHRRKPDFSKILESDGEYHDDPKQQKKDAERDAAIRDAYPNTEIVRRRKDALLGYSDEQIIELLGL